MKAEIGNFFLNQTISRINILANFLLEKFEKSVENDHHVG